MSCTQSTPTPGLKALKNMELLHSDSRIFKMPRLPKKKSDKKKSIVLDEDQYVKHIGKIIQRDFFPDLERLKAQNEFLEASENKDYNRLKEIRLKYSGQRPLTEPGASPATFDTPNLFGGGTPTPHVANENVNKTDLNKSEENDITRKHSLDSFLATHTSEDNASFDKITELEDRKRYLKHEDQFNAEKTSKELVDEALTLPSMEMQADQMEPVNEIDTWKFKARNYIMYVPDAGNNFKKEKPELVHQNTRLQTNPFDSYKDKKVISEIAKTQEKSHNGKISVDGTSVSVASVRGFVHTPSPCPGADESPFMTWGEIEGTPFRLDGGDTPLPSTGSGPAFRMLEAGSREQLAHKLAEATRRKRTPAQTPRPHTSLLTPRMSTTDRLASMSPAARRLATKHLLSPLVKSPFITRTNKAATPGVKTPTPGRKTPKCHAGKATPKSNHRQGQNITDNLLQINLERRTRSKAADFFS